LRWGGHRALTKHVMTYRAPSIHGTLRRSELYASTGGAYSCASTLFIGRMRSALSSIRDKGVAAAYRISRLTGSMLAAWRFSATQFWAVVAPERPDTVRVLRELR